MENEQPDIPAEIPNDEVSSQRSTRFKMVAVFGVLIGLVAFLLVGTGAQDAFVYSKLVNEVMSDQNAFRGRELRVEGILTQGSIRFRENPCEWHFSLEKEGKLMPVRFAQCIVPDTFRDGMNLSVTVQGKLGADGQFVADQVVPRCPSKYEMQQRKARGETMPHENSFSRGTIETSAPAQPARAM